MDDAEIQQQYKIYNQLIAKAWADPAFKARLLAEPEQVIQEAGGTLPVGQQLHAIEVGARDAIVVLPPPTAALPGDAGPLTAVLQRAAAEPAYRARLLRTPAPVLAEAGVEVPVGQVVYALEADDAHGYVFVPTKPEGLDDETLGEDDVAGYFSCCGSGAGASTSPPVYTAQPIQFALLPHIPSGWPPH